jgi:DNA-directed RNA polymerase specialized sigma24 family protein
MSSRFDDFVARQAARQANLLITTAGFPRNDLEDLRQEMILDCFRRSPKFDPARGDWRGFVCGVIRNHAAVLVMRRRRRAWEVLAADLVKGEVAGPEDPTDVLDRRPRTEPEDSLDVSLDVQRVVEGLPHQLRSLAGLLAQMRVKEVCERTGKSRSCVYQMTCQIREAFVRAGFHTSRRRPREPR